MELSEEGPQMLGQRDRWSMAVVVVVVVVAYRLRQSKYLVSSTTQMLIENIQHWLHQPLDSIVLLGLGEKLAVMDFKPRYVIFRRQAHPVLCLRHTEPRSPSLSPAKKLEDGWPLPLKLIQFGGAPYKGKANLKL